MGVDIYTSKHRLFLSLSQHTHFLIELYACESANHYSVSVVEYKYRRFAYKYSFPKFYHFLNFFSHFCVQGIDYLKYDNCFNLGIKPEKR